MHGGPKHGPYFAHFWWQDGRRYKRYIRQQDAVVISTACSERRQVEREQRRQAEEAHSAWREVRALLREVERGER
jgi:hypothetical protein